MSPHPHAPWQRRTVDIDPNDVGDPYPHAFTVSNSFRVSHRRLNWTIIAQLAVILLAIICLLNEVIP